MKSEALRKTSRYEAFNDVRHDHDGMLYWIIPNSN